MLILQLPVSALPNQLAQSSGGEGEGGDGEMDDVVVWKKAGLWVGVQSFLRCELEYEHMFLVSPPPIWYPNLWDPSDPSAPDPYLYSSWRVTVLEGMSKGTTWVTHVEH